MLVLSRKLQEAVVIGSGITVRVVEIEHGKVRLGFTAPKGMRIDREELLRHPAVAELHKPHARPAMGDAPSPVA